MNEFWFSEHESESMPIDVWSKTTTDLVVASYNENLRWCAMWEIFNPMMNLLPNCSLRVYRTGTRNGESLHLKEDVVYLENKGREASQWLAHIVLNYEKLADISLFLQADLGVGMGSGVFWPIDLNLFKRFRFPIRGHPESGPIDDFAFYNWPSFDRLRCNITTPGMMEKHNFGVGPNRDTISSGGLYETAKLLHGKSCPPKIVIPMANNSAGAQFMVTKALIRRKSVAYYQKLMDNVKKYELAHALEYSGWPSIVFDIYNVFPDPD